MVICSTCGSRQPDGAAFCDECGAALSAPPVAGGAARGIPTVMASLCPVCGAQVAPGEQFCNSCGASLGGSAPAALATPAISGGGLPTVAAPSLGGQVCANCGAALEPDSAFCDMCGAPVQKAAPGFAPAASAIPAAYTPPAAPVIPVAYAVPAAPAMPPAYAPPAASAEYGPTMAAQPGPASYPSPVPAPQGFPQPTPQPAAYARPPLMPSGRLVVVGSNVTLPFPPGKTEIIIGREDPVSGVFPDIDLTDHGGDEGGVSRQHARILIQGENFFIEDLNSTNFTFLNQQKLPPRQPQALNNGDEVRLGRVKLLFQA